MFNENSGLLRYDEVAHTTRKHFSTLLSYLEQFQGTAEEIIESARQGDEDAQNAMFTLQTSSYALSLSAAAALSPFVTLPSSGDEPIGWCVLLVQQFESDNIRIRGPFPSQEAAVAWKSQHGTTRDVSDSAVIWMFYPELKVLNTELSPSDQTILTGTYLLRLGQKDRVYPSEPTISLIGPFDTVHMASGYETCLRALGATRLLIVELDKVNVDEICTVVPVSKR